MPRTHPPYAPKYRRRIIELARAGRSIDQLAREFEPTANQGSQYTSIAFGRRCRDAGVRPSLGSVGDCFDNAMCESFFATLECELLDRRRFKTQSEARMAVFEFIEGWYNPHRSHSALDYLSPIDYEKLIVRRLVTAAQPRPPTRGNSSLKPPIIAADPPRLPLPDHVHRLVSLDRPAGSLELAKALLGLHSSFDRSMILLHDVVQVLDRSMSAAAAQGSFLFHVCNRRAVEAGLIGVDDAGLRMRWIGEGLAEQASGRRGIAQRRQ